MGQANRIILNALSNYGLTIITMASSMVMVPIVVRDLTRVGYGVAAVVMAVLGTFELLSNLLGRALQRHIPQDLAGNTPQRVNQTFNTARLGLMLIGVLGALVVWVLGSWLLEDPQVSDAMIADGQHAFLLLIVWLVFAFPLCAYQKGLEAIQRYDMISAYLGAVTLVRTVAVIVIFVLGYGSITVLIGSYLVATLICFLLCRRLFLRLTPQVKVSLRMVDGRAARTLGIFVLGVMFVVCGNLLSGNGFRLFVGKRLGMDELGGLAAVLALAGLMWKLIYNLANVLPSAVSAQDARGLSGNVAKILTTGTKYSVVVSVSICLVPISIAGAFFQLWLGDEFAGLDALLAILLLLQIPLCLGSASIQVLMGMGKLSLVGAVVFSRGVIGLLLAWGYVELIQPNVTGAVAWNSSTQAVGGMVVLMYALVIAGVPRLAALINVFVRPVMLGLVAALLTWWISVQIGCDQWWKLIVSVSAGELLFLALVLVAGLTGEECSRMTSFASAAGLRLRQVWRRSWPG